MAKVAQGIKYKYAKNANAKYKVTYRKYTYTETKNVNGVSTKYTYSTYKKAITPKKNLSYQ